MKTVEGLYYSESHEWVKVDGEVAIIGITDFAQKAMGRHCLCGYARGGRRSQCRRRIRCGREC